MPFYRQCELHRGPWRTYSWLPEKFAKKGRYVKLKDQGAWQDGWQVKAVGSMRRSEAEALERSQDHKHQRRASDI